MQYDNALQTVPTSIIAGWFGFQGREYFELDDPAAREAPKVSFSDPAPAPEVPAAPPAEPQAPSA
jgi:LemA protein